MGITVQLKEKCPPKLRHLLELLGGIDDENLRAEILVDYSKKYREVPASVAIRPFPREHLVAFCESEAYIWTIPKSEGGWNFYFVVENPSGISARALAAIMVETLSDANRDQILSIPTDVVEMIFRQNISMGKGLGLQSMLQTLQRMVSITAA